MSNNKDFKVKNGIQPTVYHEAVGTVVSGSVGYNIAGASYDGVSFSVASQDTFLTGIFFKPDGSKMYACGNTNDTIFQYSLSTSWDLSTASYDSKSFSVASQDTFSPSVFFKDDGLTMFTMGGGTDAVYEYTLSTAWDVSTASYTNNSFSVNSQAPAPRSVFFKSDGTKMYVVEGTSFNAAVYEYALSTAWDITSASYNNASYATENEASSTEGLFFKSDGLSMFAISRSDDTVYEYSLSTAWDLSTVSYTGISYRHADSSGETTSYGVFFKPDGTTMFISGSGTDTIYQYSTVLNTAELDLSSGSVFDYTPTSDVQVTLTNPAASGTSSGATLLLGGSADVVPYDLANATYDSVSLNVGTQGLNPYGLELGDSGIKLYSLSASNDTVFQYDLSTAWDLSTASYSSKSFNVGSTSQEPESIRFKADGTKMYVTDKNEHEVNEYTLSTAWDVSTASHSTVFSVSSQGSEPAGLAFKTDGTKMYVAFASGTSSIAEYNLSTAWDLSTASYSQNSTVINTTPSASGIMFSDDGTRLYTSCRFTTDAINEYSLSTAWDVSTLSYVQNFLVGTEDGDPTDLYIKPDGTKMYMVGYSTDQVYQYSLSSSVGRTVTYDTSLQWSGGTAPTSPAIGETDVLTFNTTDGGTTYQAVQAIDGAK